MNKTATEPLIWYGSHSSAMFYLNMLEREENMPEAVRQEAMSAYTESEESETRFKGYDEYVQAVDNVAIVSISGSLVSKESWLSRIFGVMAYDTLGNIMAILAEDSAIDTAILDIDSPGGQAKGLDAATDAIQAAVGQGLKVVSHSSGQMSSAAYWIGASAEQAMGSEHSEIGSVGVIAVHAEASERNRKEGVRFTVLRKGEEKALASPYEKLSDKARAEIDRALETKYQQFIEAVATSRGLSEDFVKENIATGRVFSAQEAYDLRMIDEIISFSDLVSRHLEQGSTDQVGTPTQPRSIAAMHKKPIVNAGTISPEDAALAVAAGTDPKQVMPPLPSEEASAGTEDEHAEITVVDNDPVTDPVTPEAAAAAAAAEGGEGATGEAPASSAAPAAPAAPAAEVFQQVLATVNNELVEAKTKNAALDVQVTALTAGNVALRLIAVEQTERLRISLGMPSGTTDLDGMSDVSLAAAHQTNMAQFVKRFSSGAVSRAPEEDTTPKATVTRLDEAIKKATSFNRG